MDAKTEVEILKDTESYSTSNEDFEKGIWTHVDITIDSAIEIADFIEQQEKYAELGRLAVEINYDAINAIGCDGVNDEGGCVDCVGMRCEWHGFCVKRAELLMEVAK